MIGDVIDTFENTTPAVNQEFEEVKLRQLPVTRSHTQKFDMSIMSFQVMLPNIDEICAVNNAKMIKYLPKEANFD